MKAKFDEFTVNLYFDEDGDWLAHFVELPNISAFADAPERALKRDRCRMGRGEGKLPQAW